MSLSQWGTLSKSFWGPLKWSTSMSKRQTNLLKDGSWMLAISTYEVFLMIMTFPHFFNSSKISRKNRLKFCKFLAKWKKEYRNCDDNKSSKTVFRDICKNLRKKFYFHNDFFTLLLIRTVAIQWSKTNTAKTAPFSFNY